MHRYGMTYGSVVDPTGAVISTKYFCLAIETSHPHSRSEEVVSISTVCHVVLQSRSDPSGQH